MSEIVDSLLERCSTLPLVALSQAKTPPAIQKVTSAARLIFELGSFLQEHDTVAVGGDGDIYIRFDKKAYFVIDNDRENAALLVLEREYLEFSLSEAAVAIGRVKEFLGRCLCV